MNTNNRKNKYRSAPMRGGRGKPVERQMSADGLYGNHRVLQTFGAVVGMTSTVQTTTNTLVEGVFTTVGPNFDVVLDMAHTISKSDPDKLSPDTVRKKVIFKPSDIVTIKIKDVDLEFAAKETFQTDSTIGSRYNGQTGERELEPWLGEDGCEGDSLLDDTANGWDVNDMFKKNEEFGVQTSYTPEMEGYTTPLRKLNTHEYRQKEQDAIKLAHLIQNNSNTNVRADLENGDEEDKYSAVVRPGSSEAGPKYVPPQRRKSQPPLSKQQSRSSPSPQSGNINSNSAPRFNNNNNHSNNNYKGGPMGPSSQSNYSHLPPPHQNYRHGSQPPSNQGPLSPLSENKVNGDKDVRGVEDTHMDSRENQNIKTSESASNLENPTQNQFDNSHSGSLITNMSDNTQHQHMHNVPPPTHAQPVQMTNTSTNSDTRKPNDPKEQREHRKNRNHNKEENLADFRKFSKDFKLAETAPEVKKAPQTTLPPSTHGSMHHHPHPHHLPPHPPPHINQSGPPHSNQNTCQTATQPPPVSNPAPSRTQPPPPSTHQNQSTTPPHNPSPNLNISHSHIQNIPPPSLNQHGPPQQPPPPQNLQQPPPPPPQTSQPPPQPQQMHNPQSSGHVAQANQGNTPPSNSRHITSPAPVENKEDKQAHQLNPDAKEFVPSTGKSSFNQRTPQTTSGTPPRTQTPQSPQIIHNAGGHLIQMQTGYQGPAYLVHNPAAYLNHPNRFAKRGVPAGNQRQEFSHVAAATGQPILAPPITAPQQLTAVQLPPMIPQNPQYPQYPGTMPMMVRLPSHQPIQMLTTMVPTSMGPASMGLIPQLTSDAQQSHQAHGQQQHHPTIYMGPTNVAPQHHAPTPGPQPQQPPTPQGPMNPGVAAGGPPNIPTQPPTPVATPSQQLIYTGQPHMTHMSQPHHISQNAPHGSQPTHYVTHGLTAPQHQGMMVMLPPNMGPPPNAQHIPSSMAAAAFTPTSTALHMNPGGPISYIAGNPGTQGHSMGMLHP